MSTLPFALDEFDHRLLELLQRDADATLSSLGDAVGLSASAVQRRIKRYRESG
jgi:DNA-binding Lrp family transcriptional regulator